MVTHRRGPWSQHEDNWLISLVHRNGPHNWVRISQEIQTRSPKQCRERYHQNLKPSLNHEPITPEEGELIERLVNEMGKRWAEIARRLHGRSDNAVKNWWNGGQNRRKRNPDRPEHETNDSMHASHATYSSNYPDSYHYSHHARPVERHEEVPNHYSPHHSLPRPFSAEKPHHSHADAHITTQYPQSRRSSWNAPVDSPQSLRLPPPRSFEPCSRSVSSRPQPLELQYNAPFSSARGRGYETPMPSPSGYSVVSADGAPSLITDNGSEGRSPRDGASPLDITLAPLVGGRDERKNSCTRYLPQSGFAVEDDDHSSVHLSYNDPWRRRSSMQLPAIHKSEPAVTFKEPNYRADRPQLLTQPASGLYHAGTLPRSSLPVGQKPLPPYSELAAPISPSIVQPVSPSNASPTSRQLPLPAIHASRSAPTSPRGEDRDQRLQLSTILS